MSSPAPSLGSEDLLFFPISSSPTPHPDEEVQMMLEKARQVTSLPPCIAKLVQEKPEYGIVFERQIRLLQSRSQAFEDGHVTVYDKVLLALTRNGADLRSPAAVAYYCEEFLGVSLSETTRNGNGEGEGGGGGGEGFVQSAVSQAIDVKAMLNQYQAAPQSQSCGQTGYSERVADEQPKSTTRTDMAADLAQLWRVYGIAKQEYVALANKRNEHTIKAAKFLRDTAENTLHHLVNKNVDDIMLAELRATYEMAKTVVVSLTGGKKRKFDTVEMESVRGTPRGPRRGIFNHSHSRDAARPASVGGRNGVIYASHMYHGNERRPTDVTRYDGYHQSRALREMGRDRIEASLAYGIELSRAPARRRRSYDSYQPERRY